MLRRVSADVAQRIEQLRGNAFRLVVVGATADDTVAYGLDRRETDLFVEPIDQKICRRPVIEVAEDAAVVLIAFQVVKRQRGAAQTDAVDFAMQPSLRRVTHPVQRKLDTRRAAIHRQHVRLFLLHEMVAPLFRWFIFSTHDIFFHAGSPVMASGS